MVVQFAGPRIDTLDWQVVQGSNRLESARRMEVPAAVVAGLSSGSPASAVMMAAKAAAPDGSLWGLTFARPLIEPVDIEAHATMDVSVNQGFWVAPLMRLPGVDADEGEINLDLRGPEAAAANHRTDRRPYSRWVAAPPHLSVWRCAWSTVARTRGQCGRGLHHRSGTIDFLCDRPDTVCSLPQRSTLGLGRRDYSNRPAE